ncbi:fimbrial protein [Achromobacter sp. AGC39]
MKFNLKQPLAMVALCLAAGAVQAQSATLNVTGRITNTPCTIEADAVNLGDVSISDFTSGIVLPQKFWKTFNITLGGCELNTLSTASIRFNGTLASDSMTLALTSGTGAAQGFGVMMKSSDSTHAATSQTVYFNGTNPFSFNVTSNKKTFAFQAFYVKVGSTQRPGVANATATVTLTYA